MRFLYISDSAIPSQSANAIHVMKMCRSFAKLNLDTQLIAKNTTACIKGVDNSFDFYRVASIFSLRIFPTVAFPLSGRVYNLLLPFFAMKKFDIVYTRAIYPAFWYSVFKKKINFEIHEPFDTKGKWLKFVFRLIVKSNSISKWIVISKPIKDYLIENFKINNDNILVAHDGADLPEQNGELNFACPGKVNVGYVGSLLKGKGVEIIFELSKLMPTVMFHVVGGNSSQINEWKAKMNDYHSNLIFHGFVPHEKTTQYLQSFDILIAPYLKKVFVKNENNSNNIASWMSPLKIFEYMSVGKPIITSDLNVLKEVLEHGHTALLCDPDNIIEWKSAVNQLLENRNLSNNIAMEARKQFEENYTWDKRAEKILNFLKS